MERNTFCMSSELKEVLCHQTFARSGYYSVFTVFLRQTRGSLTSCLYKKGQAQKIDWHSLYLKKHIWSSVLENGTLQLLGLLRGEQSWKQTGKYNNNNKNRQINLNFQMQSKCSTDKLKLEILLLPAKFQALLCALYSTCAFHD